MWKGGIFRHVSVCLSLSHVRLFVTPWTVAHQAPLSMGFLQTRILDWVSYPFSRNSSDPGIKPGSPALKVDSLPAELLGKPIEYIYNEILLSHKKEQI